ncbi:MAG: glycosyltransferase [Bacillaceae bacterium]|nr:glycosyltransferase [Bacillaceae bacterium]
MVYFTGILAIFFLWTIINTFFLPRLPKRVQITHTPLISILIPLRDEQKNVHGLIQSLKRLTYPKFEVLLLEDHSSDETLPLLLEETKGLPNFHVIKGKSLPNNWIGKVFGCHQLSKKASGEYLLFIDADVRLEPNTIEATLTFAQNKGAALVTGFPRFPTNTFLGNLVIPLQHFVVLFHLPLLIANHSQKASFSAAHGAFMFFSKEGYLNDHPLKQVDLDIKCRRLKS